SHPPDRYPGRDHHDHDHGDHHHDDHDYGHDHGQGHGHGGRIDAGRWYQVAMTHRALHHSLGTFELDLDRPEPFFRRLRPRSAPGTGIATAGGTTAVPALERFFRLFGRTALA